MTDVAGDQTTTVEGNGPDTTNSNAATAAAEGGQGQQQNSQVAGNEGGSTEGGFGGGDSGQAAASAAPETYELEYADGVDEAFVSSVVDTAKELGLSNDAAQKLLERSLANTEASTNSMKEYLDNMVGEWKTARDNDPEYGGARMQESIGVMDSALKRFGTPELHKFMQDNGLFNHPEMARFFYKVGKAVGPDTDIAGGQNRQEVDTSKTKFEQQAERLYGNKSA